jgi:hypothetical protein
LSGFGAVIINSGNRNWESDGEAAKINNIAYAERALGHFEGGKISTVATRLKAHS